LTPLASGKEIRSAINLFIDQAETRPYFEKTAKTDNKNMEATVQLKLLTRK
jgi:hypothetical protein